MDKKTWVIIAMSLVIIILVFVILTGDSELETIIDEISGQRDSLIRSSEVIESELSRSIGENTQLKADNIELRNNNTELGNIIDNLTAGSEKTSQHLEGYGRINNDFAEFIRQASETN